MPGSDPNVVVHCLAIDLSQWPIKQHLRKAKHDIANKIEGEMEKLLKDRFIREVRYLKWLTNIVLIQKNCQIRVCSYYMDLNSACPKDDFPLLLTKLLVDTIMRYQALSYMDGYSGYNQIQMALEDEEATTFCILIEIFCYRVLPFSLKNVSATY